LVLVVAALAKTRQTILRRSRLGTRHARATNCWTVLVHHRDLVGTCVLEWTCFAPSRAPTSCQPENCYEVPESILRSSIVAPASLIPLLHAHVQAPLSRLNCSESRGANLIIAKPRPFFFLLPVKFCVKMATYFVPHILSLCSFLHLHLINFFFFLRFAICAWLVTLYRTLETPNRATNSFTPLQPKSYAHLGI
jgi:hypothetical protein